MQSEEKPDVHPGIERRGLPVACELRVRGERGVDVPRHVDLGHDRHVPLGGVADDVGVLRLGVVPALVAAHRRLAAVRREPRPLRDRDPPALVVGQVQVQAVELVERDQVDEPLDVAYRPEVPGDVEHRAAPGEARSVADPSRRDTRPELAQRLHAVEEAGRRVRVQPDGRARHRQLVPLRPETGRAVQRERNRPVSERLAEHPGDPPRRGCRGRNRHEGRRARDERTRPGLYGDGLRDHRERHYAGTVARSDVIRLAPLAGSKK